MASDLFTHQAMIAKALAAKLTQELGWDWKGEQFEDVCMRGGSMNVPSGEQVILELAESLASVVAALPDIAIVPVMRGDWAPGRWWRVIAPDGSLWCETSNEQEARAAVRDGDVLERLFNGPHLREWRAAGGES